MEPSLSRILRGAVGAGVLAVACAASTRAQAAARVFRVDCNGGADTRSISDAVALARSGDTIYVAPCTYEGSVEFDGKSVAIVSIGGASVTTILASPGRAAVEVDDGEAPNTLLQGFTISGGGGPTTPAIEVQFSSLTLRDVVVAGNTGPAIVYGRAAHLVLDRVTLEGNTPSPGPVVEAKRGMVLVVDSTIRCGGANVGYLTEHGAAILDRTTFDCGGATAVESYHSTARIQRSRLDGLLVSENESGQYTEPTVVEDGILLGGATLRTVTATLRNVVSTATIDATSSDLTVEASILYGADCALRLTGTTLTTRHDDVWAVGETSCGEPAALDATSFSLDPAFVDAAGGDYHLAPGSPAVDAGPTDGGYADADGSRNDLGAYGGPLGGAW